jgi:hypothetical protein
MKNNIINFIFGLIVTILYSVVNSFNQVSKLRTKGEEFSISDDSTDQTNDNINIFPKGYWNNSLFRNFLLTYDFILISFFINESFTKNYLLSVVLLLIIKVFINFQILFDNFRPPDEADKKRIKIMAIISLLFSVLYININYFWTYIDNILEKY